MRRLAPLALISTILLAACETAPRPVPRPPDLQARHEVNALCTVYDQQLAVVLGKARAGTLVGRERELAWAMMDTVGPACRDIDATVAAGGLAVAGLGAASAALDLWIASQGAPR